MFDRFTTYSVESVSSGSAERKLQEMAAERFAPCPQCLREEAYIRNSILKMERIVAERGQYWSLCKIRGGFHPEERGGHGPPMLRGEALPSFEEVAGGGGGAANCRVRKKKDKTNKFFSPLTRP